MRTPGGGGRRPALSRRADVRRLSVCPITSIRSRPCHADQVPVRMAVDQLDPGAGAHQTQSSPSMIVSATRRSPARMASFMRATVSRPQQPQVGTVMLPAVAAEARRPRARVRSRRADRAPQDLKAGRGWPPFKIVPECLRSAASSPHAQAGAAHDGPIPETPPRPGYRKSQKSLVQNARSSPYRNHSISVWAQSASGPGLIPARRRALGPEGFHHQAAVPFGVRAWWGRARAFANRACPSTRPLVIHPAPLWG